MKFNILIPIRSKSRGLKNKNILKFNNNINLTNYTIQKLLKIKNINKIFILTDSKLYKKKIINHQKIDKTYIRPEFLSKSNSKIQDLISHFLLSNSIDAKVSNFALMQVTSPMLSIKEIKQTFNFIDKTKLNSLMHISEVLESPNEIIVGQKKRWNFLINKRITNRQNYKKKYFFITGSLFYFTKNFFLKFREMYNNKTFAYKVDKINFVDIDDSFTFEISKKLTNMKIRN
jgi:CMP-N-acetylneuraminic acid synthetase